MESTTPRVNDTTTVTTPGTLSRVLRRTAVLGLGAALIAGIATPSFASTTGTTAPTGTTITTTTPAAPAAPAAPVVKVAAPADRQLEPHGKPHAAQSSIHTSGKQLANAKAIIKASKEMHLPPRAAVIAVATSLQETKLNNYGNLGHRNDHDSLGLFQQRPSCGWGTPGQIVNPDHAAKAFLSRLVKVHNWDNLPLTVAAQKVQVSAFGDRYAQWENQAAHLVKTTYNNA